MIQHKNAKTYYLRQNGLKIKQDKKLKFDQRFRRLRSIFWDWNLMKYL